MDKYSKVTEQKLLLRGRVRSSLPTSMMKRYVFELGLGRFDRSLTTDDANHRSVLQWCRRAVKDTQTKRDVVDDQTGDAIVTLKAKMERCSQVFKYDLQATHSCQRAEDKKGKVSIECEVDGTMKIYKYKADQSSGRVRYTRDKGFGEDGIMVKTARFESSSSIGVLGERVARKAALGQAVTWAARLMSRELRNIKAFQISAPIIAVRGWTAHSCLAKDVVEQDLPFHVVYASPQGEQRAGFIKARRRYDGCTLTPSLRERRRGGTPVEIKPMEAQIILGSPKAGMTMREMPTMHLNAAVGVSKIPVVGVGSAGSSTSFDVIAEYNGGRHAGLSEVHQYAAVHVTGSHGLDVRRDSVGILKRAYLRALFIEAGVGFNRTQYDEDDDTLMHSYGIEVRLGLGAQVIPRGLLRAQVGYHAAQVIDAGIRASEAGAFAGIHWLVTL